MAHAGQPKDDGTPDTAVEPIFADDVPSLIEKLQSVLASIRTERLAGGAPRLLLEDDNEKDGDLALFASSYTLDSLRQWGSAFSRYTLPKGEINSVLRWDAGKKMEVDAERQKKLYTVDSKMDINDGANTVLIDDLIEAGTFDSIVGIPKVDTKKFSDWLAKYTNASGVQNENGVLGNMEHSVYLTVGKPTLAGLDENRVGRIYIQTNRGVLHSLNYDTGSEQWGFIPPNILQNRLRHQKFEDNIWMGGDGVNTRSSQPLMLLDGLLAANDILLGGTPVTYMAGTLGWAGNGFYMMDVTNPSETKPKFIWAIDNDRYETPKSGSVHRWGNAFANYNKYEGYEDLGLTIVAPELKGVRELSDEGYGQFRYVGIIPGGLGYNLNDSQGRAFYIFEPGDGSIIKKITTANGYAGPAGSTLGMGITPVHYLYDNEKTKLHAKEFFTGDSEGNVLYCDLTYPVDQWKLKSIFRLRSAGDGPVALSVGYRVLQDRKGNQWLFGGTSNITAPGQVMITMPSGEKVNQQRGIRNDEQYVFGLHLKNPRAEVKTDLSYPPGNISDPATLDDLTPLKYLKTTSQVTPIWSGEVSEDQPTIGPDGWKLGLRPKIDDEHKPTEAEYVTAEPFFLDGVLYAATFIPFTELPTAQERCRDIGYGKLYAIDPENGKSMWKGGQAYVFRNIKIVGVSAARGNLFLGIKVLKGGALEEFGQYEETKDFVTHAEHSIVEIHSARSQGPSLPDIVPEIPHLQYWRETF
jgi:hypothetical protein